MCVLAGRASDEYGRTSVVGVSLAVSAACSLVIGTWAENRAALWVLGLLWGSSVICDSAQYSAMVSELVDRSYTGTAVTLQVALGYSTTIPPLYLLSWLKNQPQIGWRWAFSFLTPGPLIALLLVMKLRSMPRARLIANGRK